MSQNNTEKKTVCPLCKMNWTEKDELEICKACNEWLYAVEESKRE